MEIARILGLTPQEIVKLARSAFGASCALVIDETAAAMGVFGAEKVTDDSCGLKMACEYNFTLHPERLCAMCLATVTLNVYAAHHHFETPGARLEFTIVDCTLTGGEKVVKAQMKLLGLKAGWCTEARSIEERKWTQACEMQKQQLVGALGLLWKSVEEIVSLHTQIDNEALALALQSQVSFTNAEWFELKVNENVI